MTFQEKLANAPIAEDLFDELSESEKKYENMMAKISIQIKRERLNLGMTQKEFAQYMKVKQATVSKWESGDVNFSIRSAVNIFNKIGVPFDICFSEIVDYRPKVELWKTLSGSYAVSNKALMAG